MAFYNETVDNSVFDYGVGGAKDAFNYYAEGYRRAAETLTKSLRRRRGFLNCEALPVVFLYRHAFELSLKHAIYKAAEYADYADSSNLEARLHNDHNLRRLAGIVVDSLKRLFSDDLYLQKLLPRITATSCELADLDASSYVSRYPIDTIGHPSTDAIQFVNLRLFARHMSSLLEEMDTLNVYLDNITDTAQEAFTEWFRNLDYSP